MFDLDATLVLLCDKHGQGLNFPRQRHNDEDDAAAHDGENCPTDEEAPQHGPLALDLEQGGCKDDQCTW